MRLYQKIRKSYRNIFFGKDKFFVFFIGEVMKKSKGKENPKLLNELMQKRLNELKTNT